MDTLLVIGCGDIARRALPELQKRYRVSALVRDRDPALAAAGVELIEGDLDHPESLAQLGARASFIAHLAPPPENGVTDSRTRNLLAALERRAQSAIGRGAGMLPQHFLYLSTSGVYGDCGGARVDETSPPSPSSGRAQRRLDAERAIQDWGARLGIGTLIFRVPGLYASDRLPLERLRRGVPALRAEDDVYTNHIHADDLASAVVVGLERNGIQGIFNVNDDSEIKMGDYFDLVADRQGLPRPSRVSRAEAQRLLPPAQLSFMSESRRLVNRRMKLELGVSLRYATVADGIPALAVA